MDKKTRLKAANQILQALRSCFDTETRLAKVVEENIGKAHKDGHDLLTKEFDQLLLGITRELKGRYDPRKELAGSMASAIAGAKSVHGPKPYSQPGKNLVQ